jgi:hypothetical protein
MTDQELDEEFNRADATMRDIRTLMCTFDPSAQMMMAVHVLARSIVACVPPQGRRAAILLAMQQAETAVPLYESQTAQLNQEGSA